MRWLILVLAGIITVAGCTSAPSAATTAAPAAQPAQAPPPAKPTQAAAPTVDGIRVTVDGQTFDITGEVKVSSQRFSGIEAFNIGKNPRPSALVGGNGVLLELQTAPGKDSTKGTLSAGDIAAVTLTIWKGVEFSYMSTGAIPGKPIEKLVFSQSSGKLVGSYEDNLNGTLGRMHARIDFGVPLPR